MRRFGVAAAVGLAMTGLLVAGAPAAAQYVERPDMPVGMLPAQDVAEIVQAMGLEPLGAPVARGPFYLQRARDEFGRVLRVTVDARRSRLIAVEGAGPPRGAYAGYGYAGYGAYGAYGPYAGYGPYRGPYDRRPYPGYAPDEQFAPPGSAMGAREPSGALPPPPRSASITPDLPQPPIPGKPKPKSAAATPQHPPTPPTPRSRPAAAPREAAGSVEPQGAAQTSAPSAAPPAPAAKPDRNAMPPVAPLE